MAIRDPPPCPNNLGTVLCSLKDHLSAYPFSVVPIVKLYSLTINKTMGKVLSKPAPTSPQPAKASNSPKMATPSSTGPPPGANANGPPPFAQGGAPPGIPLGAGPPPGVIPGPGGPPPGIFGPPIDLSTLPKPPPSNPSLPAILILCTSSTAPGHVLPLTAIATHLVQKGYPVHFVGGVQHAHIIASSGAHFISIHESLSLAKGPYRKWGMERANYPEGLPRMVQDFKTFFIGQIEGQFLSSKAALEDLRDRYGKERKIIVVNETMWFGFLPFKYGASLGQIKGWDDGEEVPKTVGINVTPVMLDGEGMPPFPLGILPGEGEGVRERDRVLKEWYYKYVVKEAYDGFRDNIRRCGGVDVPDGWMVNLSYTAHDVTLQLCDEVLEYPRPDLPPHVMFAGSLPPKKGGKEGYKWPEWWKPEVLERKEGRRIVVVSQGTLARDYTMLLAPTVKGLAGREDVLVIALLGKQGLETPPEVLPRGVELGNVKVVDFLPYDSVLEHADVMVFNAGYGGFVHCIVNGVPVVAAGLTEDKCEVSARVEWTGAGINLRTGRPTPDAVAAAVDTILGDDKYRSRVRELAGHVAKGNPVEVVEKEIIALS